MISSIRLSVFWERQCHFRRSTQSNGKKGYRRTATLHCCAPSPLGQRNDDSLTLWISWPRQQDNLCGAKMNRLSTYPEFGLLNAYNISPTLSGYQQVYSERGRLYYLPEELYNILFEENAFPSTFNYREQRPHRIHIARIHPDYEEPSESTSSIKARRISISVFFTKSKDSAKKFFKFFVLTGDPSDPQRDRPLSWISVRSTSVRRPRSGFWPDSKRRSRVTSAPVNMRQSMEIRTGGPVGGPRGSISVDEGRRASVIDTFADSPLSPTFATHKPLASGNGVALSVGLAEPVIFLQGFEQGDLQSNRSTAMLRGSLHLRISKPAKIKAVTLRFRGRALTKWPEGKTCRRCIRSSLIILKEYHQRRPSSRSPHST